MNTRADAETGLQQCRYCLASDGLPHDAGLPNDIVYLLLLLEWHLLQVFKTDYAASIPVFRVAWNIYITKSWLAFFAKPVIVLNSNANIKLLLSRFDLFYLSRCQFNRNCNTIPASTGWYLSSVPAEIIMLRIERHLFASKFLVYMHENRHAWTWHVPIVFDWYSYTTFCDVTFKAAGPDMSAFSVLEGAELILSGFGGFHSRISICSADLYCGCHFRYLLSGIVRIKKSYDHECHSAQRLNPRWLAEVSHETREEVNTFGNPLIAVQQHSIFVMYSPAQHNRAESAPEKCQSVNKSTDAS